MKKIIYFILTTVIILTFVRCSDWNNAEPIFEEPVNDRSEEYYAALREYKKTDHSVTFGWYSAWTGIGTNMYNQLRGMPDSMDIISIWDNGGNLTQAQTIDLLEVQKVKGTKVLLCLLTTNIGVHYTPSEVENNWIVDGVQYNSRPEALAAFWGWYGRDYRGTDKDYGDTSPEGVEKAIRKYANAMIDSVYKYGYDGFDIDFEPNYTNPGNIAGPPGTADRGNMHIFIDEFSKHFGPKSGTDRILMVDGEPQTLNPESGPLLDYYVIQAYSCSGDRNLDSRFNNLANNFSSVEDAATVMKKLIWTEDFEKHKDTGGPLFKTRDGVETYSLMGMAMYYRPELDNVRIGGVGAYRFNLCRPVNDYLFMREVIQELNPAKL